MDRGCHLLAPRSELVEHCKLRFSCEAESGATTGRTRTRYAQMRNILEYLNLIKPTMKGEALSEALKNLVRTIPERAKAGR